MTIKHLVSNSKTPSCKNKSLSDGVRTLSNLDFTSIWYLTDLKI